MNAHTYTRAIFHRNGNITFYSTALQRWMHNVPAHKITRMHLDTFEPHDRVRVVQRAKEQRRELRQKARMMASATAIVPRRRTKKEKSDTPVVTHQDAAQ